MSSDFKNLISQFLRSEHSNLKDFEKLLKESELQTDWLDAVTLYRKGVLALQKNDLSGLDIIRQANDSLKKIVSVKSTDSTTSNLQALNESIVTTTQENLLEQLDLIKFNFGVLYEACTNAGYKPIENEEMFYEDEEGDGNTGDDTSGLEENTDQTVPVVDGVTETPTEKVDPVVDAANGQPQAKESGYAAGFDAGKSYMEAYSDKFTNTQTIKEAIKQKIVSELHSKPYRWVQSYQEGFLKGCTHQQEVHKELYPEEWKKYEETCSTIKK